MTEKLMKGHTFAKGKKKLTYPASAEVKVDEIRLDVRRSQQGLVLMQSYADKPLYNLGLWASRFGNYMEAFNVQRLDMGVIVNGSFADTYRYVRSKNGVPAELENCEVKFILFDLPDNTKDRYIDRIQLRRRAVSIMADYDIPAFTPRRLIAHCEADVMALYDEARAGGYEGLMVKSHDHLYEAGKRTNGWLKVKPEDDADALINGVTEATSEAGVPLGRVGSIQGTTEDGQAVSIPGIDHDTGRLWFADPSLIVGQWVEFQYMERDRQGGFRHPRFNRIREAKA